jgi:sigma-E factor negative regulatory protein RseC
LRDFGKIIDIKNDTAQVLIQPHGGCGNCSLKGTCATNEDAHLLWANNPKSGKIGDEVVIELKPEVKIFGSALVFILPLVGLFLGYLAGDKLGGNTDYAVLGAIIGLVLFFGLVRLIDKLLGDRSALKPVITHVLS